MQSSNELKQQYEHEGYIVLEKIFHRSTIDRLNGETDAIFKQQGESVFIYESDNKTVKSIVHPERESDSFANLVCMPELLNISELILEDKLYLFQMAINTKSPFRGGVWQWHRDFPTYKHEDYIPECRMINAIVLLDDFNRTNGSFLVLPGSHKGHYEMTHYSRQGTTHRLHYANDDEVSEKIESCGVHFCDYDAGSVVLMNPNLLHSSGANLSNLARRLVTITYNCDANRAKKRSNRPKLVNDDSNLSCLKRKEGARNNFI